MSQHIDEMRYTELKNKQAEQSKIATAEKLPEDFSRSAPEQGYPDSKIKDLKLFSDDQIPIVRDFRR